MTTYRPEGLLIDTPENCAYLKSISALEEAMREGRCLEGRAVVCDSAHNLYVDLGCTRGIIPRRRAPWALRTAPPGTSPSSPG